MAAKATSPAGRSQQGAQYAQIAKISGLTASQLPDPQHAFPGYGQMKPEQQEIDRLRKEVAKLKAERDILKRPQPSSRGKRYEVHFHREAPFDLAGGMSGE